MGKIRSSIASRHQEEHQEEDLTATYKAKFPILLHEEGDRFITLKFREMVGCKYIPSSFLQDVGMHDSLNQLLTTCGLKKFMSMQEHIYIELITEIYTSLEVNPNDSYILEFQML